jgi:hypothetical protein
MNGARIFLHIFTYIALSRPTRFEKKIGTIFRWGNKDGSFIQVVFPDDDTASNAMFFGQ